ncbi:MAG: M23 family metallopeptidase [Clostridia bacterium]|nr:M23 family metallopeptidase [Clostridia bacterium]
MQEKKREEKTAQILYMAMILGLVILAAAVGIVSISGRREMPAEMPQTPAPAEPTQTTARTAAAPAQPKTPSQTVAPSAKPETAAPVKDAVELTEPEDENRLPSFILPVVGTVSKLCTPDVLVFSSTMNDYRAHTGVDISTSLGEAVCAAADGVVTEIYADPMMGCTVVLAHDGDALTVYQNLDENIEVEVGARVRAGDVLGAVGETAMVEIAEEPHLHFEMQVAGVIVDPLDHIAQQSMTLVYEDE